MDHKFIHLFRKQLLSNCDSLQIKSVVTVIYWLSLSVFIAARGSRSTETS